MFFAVRGTPRTLLGPNSVNVMNCEDFGFIVRELARAQSGRAELATTTRTAALAHTQNCAACAARLADERQLSAGLTALAAHEEGLSAPPALESTLLAAFRQTVPAAAVTAPTPTATVLPFIAKQPRQWLRWSLAAAALLFMSFVTWAWRNATTTGQPVEPATTMAQQASPTPAHAQVAVAPIPVNAPSLGQTVAYRANAAPNISRTKPRRAPRYRIERYLVESEIVTDFMPLTDTATWPRNTTLQTVRIELPRTVLSRFGLPLSVERADEVVKADLLVGPDGLTRAIRFVQSEFQEPQIITAHNVSVREH